ncbi:MAG: hypothetical protein ACXWP5_13065 [Bdellovibrionota bacterium]
MKVNKLKVWIALSITLLGASAFAKGGIDGSGGDPRGSTKIEVLFALSSLKADLGKMFDRLQWADTGSLPETIDPLLAILVSPPPKKDKVFGDITASNYSLKPDGPCQDLGGSSSAAAAVVGQLGGDICFSLPELMKIPPESLRVQLVALAAHEHLHHFGGTEEQAVLLQDFLLRSGRNLAFGDPLVARVAAANQQLSANSSNVIREISDPQVSVLLVCRDIGQIDGLTSGLFPTVTSASDKGFDSLPKDLQGAIMNVVAANGKLQSVCKGDPVLDYDVLRGLLLTMVQKEFVVRFFSEGR